MSEVQGYDDMGNIKSLNRDSRATAYGYLNSGRSNRLDKLTGGFVGSTPKSYSYDPNGNATLDRTGTAFAYNHLNLPKTASRAGVSVSHRYDALGIKLQKYSKVGDIETTRDYVGGIEYKKEGTGPLAIDCNSPYDYNTNNGGGSNMLLIVNTKGIDVKVKKGFDNLSDGKDVVWWNPNTASEVKTNTGENVTLSPATLLEHEFDH